MAAISTVTLAPNVYSYYHKMLLDTAKKSLQFLPLAKKKIHPKGNGKDSFLLKYGHVASSTSQLSEGVVPTQATIATNKYTVTVNQYGQYLALTDFVITTAIDPVLEDITEQLGYTAAKSTDEVIRDHLVANATTSIQYVGAGIATDNSVTATSTFVAADVVKGIRILKAGDAKPFDDGKFIWLVNSYVSSDIMVDTGAGGFIDLSKYVDSLASGPMNGEIGKAYGARIIETNNISSVANNTSVNVYRTMLFAKDAFAMTSFDKDHTKIIVKQVGQSGISDPLDQIGTCGYKLEFGVKYIGGTFASDNGSSPDLCLQIRGAATAG